MQLEELYQKVIDWTTDEQIRRDAEVHQLQHGYNSLLFLPAAEKPARLEKVLSWAKGLVILEHPEWLAWSLVFEMKDCHTLGEFFICLRELQLIQP